LRGLAERFESRILPLFRRRTEQVGDLLLELYLHGLSQGDFVLALQGLLGEGAPLSAASIERLRAEWQAEYDRWRARALHDREPVYVWADGIYVRAGLEKERAALLVVIGAMSDGRKEVLSVVPGYRESSEAWAGVLRELRDQGLVAPKVVIADGNLGIWGSVRQVWPNAAEQRCWNHKIVNVRTRLPKRLQRQATAELSAIPYAPTRAEANRQRDAFVRTYRSSYPEAVACLENDWERMLTFYDFPEPHWRHLRTTNVVESPFAALRLRTTAAKRFRKATSATCLIWKALMLAEKRFRKLNAPVLAEMVYRGTLFAHGELVTNQQERRVAA
jgi:transposase-like protein